MESNRSKAILLLLIIAGVASSCAIEARKGIDLGTCFKNSDCEDIKCETADLMKTCLNDRCACVEIKEQSYSERACRSDRQCIDYCHAYDPTCAFCDFYTCKCKC